MLLLALAGMFVASTIAIFQTDLKRLFAYSSVGQIGYIIARPVVRLGHRA